MRHELARLMTGVLLVLPISITSCMMNETEVPDFNKQLQSDLATIDNYLATNNITAQQDPDGLVRYVIYRDSTDTDKPTVDSCVTATYAGKLLSNGQEFDNGENISFPLSQVIVGWQVAIPLLNEGDSAAIYIPSGLAYGYYGSPPAIPSNANLIFHVALNKVGSTYKTSDRSCN